MCGIVGVLDPKRTRPTDESERLVARMADAMITRGPDAAGAWVDEQAGVAFGHRRLSILDLSDHGAQPMRSADGRHVLTYNGEIYNHREIATELASAGVAMRGHSDTEVLVEAIARWGLDATLDRIDGMFAFGLWDRHERTLTLVRDRMGEKPIYWGLLGNGEMVFASTLHAIRRHPAFDRSVDRNALALYFRHKYVPAPWSIYEGVHKLEPGHLVTIGEDGEPGEPTPYWSLFDVAARGETFQGTPGEAVDELDRLLRRSVQDRMVADVPVGAFLSGGIDSTAVVAAAQLESADPVRTFTIGSASADFDESDHARAVARHLGTDHTELTVTDSDARALVDELGGIWDEPFGDSSQIPTMLVSELARRDVTVALSGDGGDELFLGYNRYSWVPAIWSRVGGLPLSVRRAAAGAGRNVPVPWWDKAGRAIPASRRPRMLGLKVTKALGVLDAPTQEDVFHRLTSHWSDPWGLVKGSSEMGTVHTDSGRWPRTDDFVEHMALVDAVTYLPDDILTKVDRATMSVSLEGRIPLLSRDIVEFAVSLPTEMRRHDGRSKWPLRELVGRSVPTDLMDRPKAGFGVPLADWLRGPLRDWAGDRLNNTTIADIIDRDLVLSAWNRHQSRRENEAYKLWDVIAFSAWCESSVDGPTVRTVANCAGRPRNPAEAERRERGGDDGDR